MLIRAHSFSECIASLTYLLLYPVVFVTQLKSSRGSDSQFEEPSSLEYFMVSNLITFQTVLMLLLVPHNNNLKIYVFGRYDYITHNYTILKYLFVR